jgi:prepilin-type N-terminal cleavage/methylation domain-containing protein
MENICRHIGESGRAEGFTLIEVLISLLIIAFGLVAVIEGLSASTNLVFKSRKYQGVGELAEREVELVLLQMDKVRDLGDGGELSYTREWDDVSYRCRLRVSSYQLMAGGKEGGEEIPFYKVELTVTTEGEHPQSLTLQTSFSKEKIVDWSTKNTAGPAAGIHFGRGVGGPKHGGSHFPLPFPFPQGRR